jgi:hypothetical protein
MKYSFRSGLHKYNKFTAILDSDGDLNFIIKERHDAAIFVPHGAVKKLIVFLQAVLKESQ